MAAEAELGLKWRDEYNRGGTEVGVARARDISNLRNLSFDTVQRMNSYFSRHAVDKEATGWNDGEEGFPTAGRIAWQLWGGDAGRDWAARIVERVKKNELSDEDGSAIAEALIALGEDADPDWFLLDEFEVDYETDDFENAELETAIAHELATSTGTARPNSKSEQDKTIEGKKFYVRYRYDGAIKPNSRPFCKEMIKANKLYRKEDIINMKNSAVNPGWGPNGTDRYSVWEFKGGGLCGHTWNKLLFISAKGFGLDLSNPNVKDKAWSEAEKAGLKIRNNWRVDREPRDMPYKGFLPDNPVWGANGSAYK